MTIHIHLDALGGISGNMFVGALLDCLPVNPEELEEQMERAGFADLVLLSTEAKTDGILCGTYFNVRQSRKQQAHSHRHFSEIRDTIAGSELDDQVKRHALGIFQCLAEAEAAVHGTDVAQVAFHEVGAWDSIADIVAAAWLIALSSASHWSVSSLPMGSGVIESAHGKLPVPAPATVLLLEGFRMHDDGIAGERVTPTGAAILRYLDARVKPLPAAMTLYKSGLGFGSRQLPGISNVLRAMVFSGTEESPDWLQDRLLELTFEVDDQRPEDLALAVEKIRRHDSVLDLVMYPVQGKKGRTTSSIRILLEPAAQQQVMALCFNETTTLGIRHEFIERAVLRRMDMTVNLEDGDYRAKLVQRPNGELTVKAELADLADSDAGYAGRELLRQEIEAQAIESLLEQDSDEDQ